MKYKKQVQHSIKLQAIIVDDEKYARENLSDLLTENCPSIEVIGTAADPVVAEKMINEINPDLLFLDIRLSSSTGFELLEKMQSRDFGVIFVTAYDSYALKAIKFSAVDYIMKPIDPDELIIAVEKYSRKIESERKSLQLELLIENLSKERAFNRLAVNIEDRTELLILNKIIRLKGESNYTRFYLEKGVTVLVSKTLVEFEDLLSDLGFLRIHKTHLVNINHVKSIEKNGEVKLLLSDGTILPVSRRRKALVVEYLSTSIR